MDGSLDIDALIKGRFHQTGPDSRASRQMNDLIERGCAKERIQGGPIFKLTSHEGEFLAVSLQRGQVPLFDGWIVEGIEIIEGADGVTQAEQLFANVGSDETSSARNQEVHGATLAERAGHWQ